jgi:PAS domain S-box-containing protein
MVTGVKEAVFEILFESAPDGILVADSKGQILMVNQELERLFGYSRDELLGKPVETLVPRGLRTGHKGYRQAYQKAPRARAMGLGFTLLAGQRKDGGQFKVEIGLSPVNLPAGGATIAIVRDLSMREQSLTDQDLA